LFILVVETPSGTILGQGGGDGYKSTSSPGTGTCVYPFGGAAATGVSSVTGGAIDQGGECTLSDAGQWAQFSLTSGGCVSWCSGSSGLAAVISACSGTVSSLGVVFNPPTASTGDTSQVGTYNVVACWYNEQLGAGADFNTAQTSFTISSSLGVPEFAGVSVAPLLMVVLLLPALLLLRKRTAVLR